MEYDTGIRQKFVNSMPVFSFEADAYLGNSIDGYGLF